MSLAAWAGLSLASCAPTAQFQDLDLAGSTVAVQPANVVAGPAGQAQVRVAAHGGSGAAVTDARVHVVVAVAGCTVTPAAAPLDAEGVVAVTVSDCTAGQHAVRASAVIGALQQPLAATSSLNAYVPAASAADSVSGGSPLSVSLDAGYGYEGTVQFTSTDPLATLPGPLVLGADRHGVVVLPRQAALRTPGLQRIVAMDVASGQVLASEAFVVAGDQASAAALQLTAPAQARAGDVLQVAVRVLNGAGGAATADVGAVTLASDDLNALLPAPQTAHTGSATFAGVVLRRAGTVTLTAQAQGGASGSTTVQVAPAAMVALQLTRVDAVPALLRAVPGGDAAAPLVAGTSVGVALAARDAYGNLATNLTGPVRLSSSDPNALLPPAVTFVLGETRARLASVTLTTAGAQSITAVAINGMRATLPGVQVVPGPASRLQLGVPPGAVVGQALPGLTLATADTFGNVVAGYVGDTALSSDAAGASLPSPAHFDAGVAGPLALSGAALFPQPGVTHLRAQTVPAGLLAPAFAVVTVAPAAVDPGHVTLTGGGSPVVADGTAQAQLTLRLADVSDNPIAEHAVVLSAEPWVAVSPQPGTGGAAVATDATGVVTIALSSRQAGVAHLTAVVGPALVRLASVIFVPGAVSGAASQWQATPDSQVADGNAAIALSLVALDAQGNAATGVPVSLRSNVGGDVLTPASGVTDAQGMLQTTLQATRAGPRLLTASLSGTTLALPAAFVAGPPAAAYSQLTASPRSLAADGSQASAVTVQAADAQGNAVAGTPVALSATGTGNVWGASQGLTDAYGLFVTTLRSSVREIKTVGASLGAVALGTTVTFASGPAAAAGSTLTVVPTTLTADGTATSDILVTARDAQGRPAAGQPVRLSSSNRGAVFSAQATATDSHGQFAATVASTRVGSLPLVVAVGDGVLTATLQCVAGPPLASSSVLRLVPLAPPSPVANGSAGLVAQLVLADRFGNPVAGSGATFASTGSGNVVQLVGGPSATSDATGMLQASVQSTVAEAKAVTATVLPSGGGAGFVLSQSTRFVPGPPSSGQSGITASPASTVADGSSPITLTLQAADAQGNAVPGAAVTWAVTGSNTTLTPAAAATDAQGRAQATLTATTVGARTVTATLPGAAATLVVSFASGAASGGSSGVTASPTTVVADNSSTAQLGVLAVDAGGQPLANVAVTLSASGSGNTLNPNAGFTGADGRLLATLRSSRAEAKTVTASIGGVAATASVTFVPGAPSAVASQLTASPTNTVADGSSAIALALMVVDAQGNVVPGQAVSWSAGGSGAALTSGSSTTASDGTAGTTLTATAAGPRVVMASFAGQQLLASVRFDAGAPTSGPSSLIVSGSPAAVGSGGSVGLSVHLADAQNNPVVGTSVALASSGSGNTVSVLYPVSGTTDSAGNLQASLRSTVAEGKMVTATVGALTLSGSAIFVAGAVAGSTSTLTAIPSSITADGSTASALALVARDTFGNPVAGQSVTLAVDGANTALNPNAGTTAADGSFGATLTGTQAGARTVTATLGGTTLTAAVQLTAAPPSGATSSLSVSPTSLTADGTSAASVRVQLRDAQGNSVPGASVNLSATGSHNTLSPASGTTGSDGRFSATLTTTTAESKTLTASFTGGTATATLTAVAGPAASSRSTLSASPTSVTADGTATTTLTAQVADAQGNAVAGQTASFAASGMGNTLSAPSAVTAADGTASVTLASTHAEGKTATASFASTSVSAPVSFAPGAATAGTSSLTASPNALTADGVAASTLTVQVADAQGNPVPGAAVTLSSSGSGNLLSASSGSTDATGRLTATLRSTVAEVKVLTATAGGMTLHANATFAPGAPVSGQSSLGAVPASVPADGSSTSALLLTVRDGQGNPVPGVAVTLSASSTTLTPASGTTAADGTLAATAASTASGARAVTASFAGTTVSAGLTFTAGAATQATSQLTASPTTVVADGSTSSTLTATVKDAQGNPVPGQAVSFTVTGTGNVLSATSATTSASGVASVTLASTAAESKTVTASFAGQQLSVGVGFVAGTVPSGHVTLTASPNTLVADGVATSALTLTVTDAQSNPVAGQTVSLSASGTGNTLSPSSGTTDASGTWTSSLKSTVAEAKSLSATVAGQTVTTTATFTAGLAVASGSSVTVSPGSAVANGSAQVAVTARVVDAQGNPAAGVAVTLTSSGTGNTLSPSSGTTGADGTLVATLKSTVAETKTLTASFNSVSVTGTATFVSGPAVSSTSTLAASPTSLAADGTASTTLTATVRDAQGNPVPGQAVSFGVSGSGNTLSGSTATTSASGQAQVTLTSTHAEAKTITGNFAGTAVAGTVTFVPAGISAGTSSLTASPNSLTADGIATSTLTVQARDAQGNPVPGQTVTLTSTGSGNTLNPNSGSTDASGSLTSALKSTVAELKALTSTVGGVTLNANATFAAGPALASTSSLSASSSSVTADGTVSTTLTLQLADAQGNPVPGVSVSLSSTGTGNTLSPASGTTSATGTLAASLKSTVAESKTVTASFAGTSLGRVVTFVPGPAVAGTSSLAVSPGSIVANGSSTATLTATLRDAQGNATPGVAVALSSSGSANSFGSSSGSTAADGTLVTTLTSTVAEAKTVTAAFNATSVTSTATFVAGPAVSSTSLLAATPATLAANGSAISTLTATVRDAQGNPVVGQSVSVGVSGSANTLSGSTATTSTSGQASVTLSSTHAEAKTVTASFASTSVTTTVTFAPAAVAAVASSFTASPNSLTADGSATSTLTVQARDAQGNPVPGQAVTLTSTGSGNTLNPNSGTTDGSGSLTSTLKSTVAELKALTATVGGVTLNANATFAAGPALASTSLLTASSSSVTADGMASTTLTLQLADAQGNPVPGVSVSLSSTGTGNSLSPASGTTSASGTLAATLKSTVAEFKTVTASFAGTSLGRVVTFIPGPAVAGTSSLAVSPGSIVANGSSAATLTATLRDAQGNATPGIAVTLSSSGSANSFGSASGTTSAGGTYVTTLTSTVAESKTVTAGFNATSVTATASFVSGPAVSSTSTVAASPTTLAANGTASTTLTATVRDAQGNPVSGQSVSFGVSGSANTLSGSTATTSASGQAQVTLTSTHAESKTVTASFASTSVTTTVTFVPAAVAAGTSSFSASPNSLTADGNATSTLTVLARDAQGNPVPGQAVTLSSTGSGNTLNPNSGTTDASGSLTSALKSTVAELKALTATVGGVTLNANATFVPGLAVAPTSSLALAPGSVVADGSSTTTASLILRDAQGNAVPGQAVTLTATGSNNTFTPASGSTAANGSFAATLASTQPESKTVTASFAGTSLSSPVTFTAVAQSAGVPTVMASPSTVVANGSNQTTLTATVLDGASQPVVGQTVTFSVSGTGNTLSGSSATTNASGVASVTLSSTVAGAKTVTATGSGGPGMASVTFVAGPMAAATSTLTASPGSVVANGSSASTLTLLAKDAQGNAVTGQPVTLSASGTGNTLSAASGTTDGSGSLAVTLKSTVAQAKTVSATASGVTVSTAVTFIPGAALAGTSSVTASPASLTANGSSTTTLTVQVNDAQGNAVSGTSLTLSSSGTTNTFAASTGATNAAGTYTTTLTSTTAEAKTITASFNSTSVTTTATFVPGPPVSSTSILAASPTSVASDGSATSTLTATLKDAQGNVVPGQTITFSSTGSGNTLSATSGTSSGSGTASITLASTHAESKTVTASFAGTSISAPVSFVTGVPSAGASSFTASPNSLTADGTTASTLTVTANDAQNNSVSGQAVTLTSTGTGNTLNPNTGTTNSSGMFTTTLKSTAAQLKALTATFGGVTLNANATFTAGAASSGTSSLTASVGILTANGTSTTTLTAQVRDAQGNGVPGVAVTFSSTGSSNTFTPASGTTDAGGALTATLSSTTAEQKTVTASFAGTSASTNVTFVPGTPVAGTSTVVATPGTVTANGSSQATLTATLRDPQGNLVPGASLTLSSSGSTNTFAASTGTTGAAGTYTTTLTSTTAEAKTITASFSSTSVTTTATFVSGPAASSTSALSASPATLVADNSATTALTATVKDAQGNPVSGQTVTFTSSGSGNTFSAGTATTSGSGIASVTLRSSVAGPKTVTASFASTSVSTPVTFTAGTVVAGTSSFTASPNTLVVLAASTLAVKALDAQQNPIPGQPVTLTSTGTNNTLNPNTGTTDSTGIFTSTLTSATAELKALTATMGAVTLNANATFTASGPSSSTSSLGASPASVTANGSSTTTLTLQVNDAQGNPVPGVAVTLASTGSNNTLTPSSGTTGAGGSLSATLSSTTAEAKTVTASFAGTSVSTGVTFTPGAAVAGTSSVAVSPATVTANGSSQATVTVTLKDAQGNVVPNSLTLSSSGSTNTFAASTGATNSAGTYTTTLTSTTAEPKTITASFNATSVTGAATFVPGPPASSTSTLAASPTTLTADNTTTTTLTATVKDAQSNPVPGQTVTFTSSGSGNAFNAPTATTSAGGTASVTLRSSVAATKTVTASFASTSVSTPVTFTPGTVVAGTSSFTASPNTLVVLAASTLAVKALDAQQNPIPGQSVTLTSTGTNNTLNPNTGTTDSTGTFTSTLTSATAELKAMTATLGAVTLNANATFTASGPSSSTSSLGASPGSVTANGSSTTTLTLQVNDAQGNPVPGVAVTLASTGSNNTLTPSSGTTGAGGSLSATLSSTTAESKTVTASFAGTSVNTGVTFTPGAAVAGTSSVAVSSATVTANGSSQATVAVTLKDAQGNLAPATSLTLSSSGSTNTFEASTGATNSAGTYTTTLTSTTAEPKTITATFNATTVTGTTTFVPGPPASSTSTLAASPTSLTADNTTTTTLTATIKDAQGNPIPGQTVTFTSSGSGNTFSAPTATTSAAGTASVTLRSSVAATKIVTASFASTSVSTPVTFTPGAVVAGTSSFTASPNTLVADGNAASLLTVVANDAQSNPIPGQAVTLTSTGTGNTLNPNTGTTNSSGVFTTTLKSTVAQLKAMTATLGAVTLNANATFAAGTASTSTSSFGASPGSVTADGTSTTTLTLQVNDAQGNPVPGVAVILASTGSNNTLTPSSATTGAGGSASATLASTTAEIKTVTATFAGTSLSAPVSFVPGAAVAGTSSVVASPTSVTADGTSTMALTATLRDAQGNLVPSTSVTLSSNGTGNAIATATGTTGAAGTYTTTMTSTVAQAKTITASFNATSVTTTGTFVVGAATASTSSLAASPSSLTANFSATTTLTATVKDSKGNPISGQSVTFTSSGTVNSFSATTATTSASGVATTTLKSGKAETKTVTATFAGTSVSTAVTFVPGAVTYSSTFTASPNNLVADGNTVSTLVLTALDNNLNPIPGQAVTLSAPGSGLTLTPTSGTTNSAGALTATLTSTMAQSVFPSATMGSVIPSTMVTFVAGPATSSTSTLTRSPVSVTADGTATTTLSLVVKDAQGNGVGSQAVTMASTGSGNTLSATSGTTSVGGTLSFTLKSTVAESKTVTASFAGTSVSTTVSFVAGTAVAGTSALVAVPIQATADGSTTLALTATIKDAQGNPVGGQSVAFSSTGSANTFSPTTATTAANGTATATLASTKAEAKTVAASFASASVTAAVTFVAGSAVQATSAVTPSPSSVTANGSATTTLTVQIADAQGNAVAGQAVALIATGSGNTLSATSGTTAAGGTFTATFASTKAESKTVTASFAGASVTNTVTFVPGTMSTGTSTLVPSPALLTADNTSLSTMTLTALDAQSNPLAGASVSFAVGGSSNTLSATTATASASGVAAITVRSSQAEAKTVSATVGAVTKTASVTFGRASTARSSLTASPMSVAADGTSTTTLTATIRDPNNVLLNGVPVSLSATGSRNVFTPSSGATDSSGRFVSLLSSAYAGSRTVTATASSATLTAPVTFTVPVCSNTIMLGGPPTLPTASASGTALGDVNNDGKIDVIANAYDAFSLDVYLGHGNGVFVKSATVGLSWPPMSCVTVDMNRDGNLDIVCCGAYGLTVLLGNGTGSSWSSSYYSAITAFNCAVADFNGDTYPDAALSCLNCNYVAMYPGTSSGGFGSGTTTTVSPSGQMGGILASDFNGDGKQDIVVSDGNTTKVNYLQGAGNGTFAAAVSYGVGGSPGYGGYLFPVVSADFNGDGKLDVGTVTSLSPAGVLLGNGNGTFQAFLGTGAADGSNALFAGDITGDGLTDLVSGSLDSSVAVYPGVGNGSLLAIDRTLTAAVYLGGLGRTIALGNLNGDTRPDLVVPTRSNYVAVLLGGSYTWSVPVRYSLPAAANATTLSTAVRDFDADGLLDVVAASSNVGLYYFRGDGTGGFASPQAITGSTSAWNVAAADLNVDGKFDLIFATYPTGSLLQVVFGNGDGTFAAPVSYSTPGTSLMALSSDVNSDGNPDVVVPNFSGSNVAVFLGVGGGALAAAVNYATDPNGEEIDIVDFNGDGKPDLVITCKGSTNLDVLLNAGGGAFGAAATYSIGTSPHGVKTGDFNGDGKIDLVTSAYGNNRVSILVGNGNGTFQAPSVIDGACIGVGGVNTADMNGDGKIDVLAACQGSDATVHLLTGRGDGTFAAAQGYLTNSPAPMHVSVGDLNGDGRPDAVVSVSTAPGGISILLSSGCAP